MYVMNKPARAIVRVVSNSSARFLDRAEAGHLLAIELSGLKGRNAVVLGIPRGGIIIAQELALRVEADLDIVLSRKLGTPGQSELAMGSLSEDGSVFVNEGVVQMFGVTDSDIEQEKARQMAEIQRRSRLIRHVLPKTPLKDRLVIVTDDGVATGATMQAALWAVRQEKPQRLIAAMPVASEEAIDRLAADADEIICLRQPAYFYAVGQFYIQFTQIEDEEVLRILEAEYTRRISKTN
jgi:putative phosphoribosyl transferase